jgi:hypothetical protein
LYGDLRIHYGIKPNLDIESQRERTLIDYARISGILIFVSLACLCIVVLAHDAKRSATIPAQKSVANAATETPHAEPNMNANVPGAATATQSEPHYMALVSLYAQSSAETPNILAKPSKNGYAKGSSPGLQRAKAIRGHRVEHRRLTANLPRRSGSFESGAPRSIKMLIEMWRRAAGRNKTGRDQRR